VSQLATDEFRQVASSAAGSKLLACYQCGTCTAICPLNVPVRSVIRGAQLGIRDLAMSEALWLCATCKQCEVACPRGVDITGVIHALRELSYKERKAPPKLESALWRVFEDGTAWEGKKGERGKWAEGLGVKTANHAQHLLFLDDAVSFDPRLQRIAQSVVKILSGAGIDFAVLGDKERSAGDEVYQIGEVGFLEELAQSNIEAFKGTGAQDVITISPHSNSVFKDIYPKYGDVPPVLHYTEFISELLDHDLVKPRHTPDAQELNITYHDPCYLGRYAGVYEEPRKLLESIPGVRLAEMEDNRSNALCCGGGGGGMYVEPTGERPSHRRVAQANDTGAAVMATACPFCVLNFEDGVKTVGSGIRVMDVAEILAACVGKGGG